MWPSVLSNLILHACNVLNALQFKSNKLKITCRLRILGWKKKKITVKKSVGYCWIRQGHCPLKRGKLQQQKYFIPFSKISGFLFLLWYLTKMNYFIKYQQDDERVPKYIETPEKGICALQCWGHPPHSHSSAALYFSSCSYKDCLFLQPSVHPHHVPVRT